MLLHVRLSVLGADQTYRFAVVVAQTNFRPATRHVRPTSLAPAPLSLPWHRLNSQGIMDDVMICAIARRLGRGGGRHISVVGGGVDAGATAGTAEAECPEQTSQDVSQDVSRDRDRECTRVRSRRTVII